MSSDYICSQSYSRIVSIKTIKEATKIGVPDNTIGVNIY